MGLVCNQEQSLWSQFDFNNCRPSTAVSQIPPSELLSYCKIVCSASVVYVLWQTRISLTLWTQEYSEWHLDHLQENTSWCVCQDLGAAIWVSMQYLLIANSPVNHGISSIFMGYWSSITLCEVSDIELHHSTFGLSVHLSYPGILAKSNSGVISRVV